MYKTQHILQNIYREMPGYSCTIIFFTSWREKRLVSAVYFPTKKDAFNAAMFMAKEDGWTAPKWYHFWRWNESIRTDEYKE